MEWNEKLTYDNTIIVQCKLYNLYGKKLQEVSDKDYEKKYCFNSNIECLDLDLYEHNRKDRKDRCEKTVDAVIGIKNVDSKSSGNPRGLLVELRMNYKSAKNLDKKELIGKVLHSKDIMSEYNEKLEQHYIFVFDNKVYNLARNWFGRVSEADKSMKNYLCYSVDQINKLLESDYTSEASYDNKKLEDKLKGLIKSNKNDSFLSEIKKETEYLQRIKYREVNMYRAILNILVCIWEQFIDKNIKFTNEEQALDFEILKEYFEEIRINNEQACN